MQIEPREYQQQAVDEIMAAFRHHDVVVLDAPTGSGKTVIAELVRREMSVKVSSHQTAYVCSSLTLQDQFAKDFPDARVAKGRSNYLSVSGESTDECTGQACKLCPAQEECPYTQAKERARLARLSCINSTFFLHLKDPTWKRDLLIVDECDTMIGELVKFSEVWIPQWMARDVGMTIPKKGVHQRTIEKWMGEWVNKAKAHVRSLQGKKARQWDGKIRTVMWLTGQEWVRQTHQSALVLKPLDVGRTARQKLWPMGSKFLLMSSTVISTDQMLDELGCQLSYTTVTVPMQFPVENRLIMAGEGVKMSWKDKETCWPEMADHLHRVISETEGPHLVHTVSYALAEYLHDEMVMRGVSRVRTYRNADERRRVLEGFKKAGGVLIAPSMDRGVDFPDELARTVVVCKIPYPNLKDRLVSEKMRGPGGQTWYSVQAVRALVQMTGRATRGMDDWSRVHILDLSFRSMYSQNRRLFPAWWREAVRYQ